MSSKHRQVELVRIRSDRPTSLTLGDLYTWVIWQFPRPKDSGLCGAVRPPIANHTWYPAWISRRDTRVILYGHLDREFSDPSEAAEWLDSQPS
jgi:hypothetical protein